MRNLAIALLAAVIVSGTAGAGDAPKEKKLARRLAHAVFFQLNDASPEARDRLVEACKKYLAGHPGEDSFSVGVRGTEFVREVNDREFDVFLYVVFDDGESHEAYQKHPRHLQFIEECQANWKKVRVFDSWIVPGKAKDAAPALPLPEGAKGFAGMIQGKVVSREKGKVVIAVDGVPRTWEHSKAADPKALVGKQVLVGGPGEDAGNAKPVGLFLKGLKAKDAVTLDVAHKGGDALTVMELTEEQREAAAKSREKADRPREDKGTGR